VIYVVLPKVIAFSLLNHVVMGIVILCWCFNKLIGLWMFWLIRIEICMRWMLMVARWLT